MKMGLVHVTVCMNLEVLFVGVPVIDSPTSGERERESE